MQLHIRRVVLFAKDMAGMTDFYERKIGLKVLSREPEFVDFDAGACRLALHRTGTPKPGKTKICFYAEDVSAARAELKARGVKMGPDLGQGPGLKLCNAKDPEGNIIQLSSRR
ncbi:MAG: VOC family protein [Planctomycetota bacterium]|nr:VOC family protein [Planctomycetota bacterium]